MSRRLVPLLIALSAPFAAAAPEPAPAPNFNYMHVQASLAQGEFQTNFPTQDDVIGLAIGGTFTLSDNIFLAFEDDAVVLDAPGNMVISGIGGGIGLHLEPAEALSLHGRIGLRAARVEDDTFEFASDAGLEFVVGARVKAAKMLELYATYRSADLGDVGKVTGLNLGLVVAFNESWSGFLYMDSASYADFITITGLEGDIDLVGAGFRYGF